MKNFYLIGLTGNLGSGKSAVRRVLEQLGARGIDADLLAHAAMQRGSPAWLAIVREFGLNILKFNGEIDRQKLGARVFASPQALRRLEQIVHPAVSAHIKDILRESDTSVVVIEAIKLIEAGLHTACDAVWVVTCNPEIQIERVARDRHMSAQDARARLDAQGSLDEKLKIANVVIDNSGDENATRAQIQQAWDAIRPESARDKTDWLYGATPTVITPTIPAPSPSGFGLPPPVVEEQVAPRVREKTTRETSVAPASLEIRRARKTDLDALGIAFAKRENLLSPLGRAETLRRLGAHGYRIAVSGKRVAAFIAWDAENLVAVAREAWAESATVAARALPQLLAMVEDEAKKLQCEVLLVLVDPLAPPFVIEQTRARDYQPRNLQELHPVWRQIAFDQIQAEDEIWVKRLREALVTQPF